MLSAADVMMIDRAELVVVAVEVDDAVASTVTRTEHVLSLGWALSTCGTPA